MDSGREEYKKSGKEEERVAPFQGERQLFDSE